MDKTQRSFGRIVNRQLSNENKNIIAKNLAKIIYKDCRNFENYLMENINDHKLCTKLQDLKTKQEQTLLKLAKDKELILEIGSGNGEFIIEKSQSLPKDKYLFIASDPFINGVANILKKIEQNKIENILVYPDDVRKLVPYLPKKPSKIYILQPDPWPKLRHWKRRLINSEFVKKCEEILVEEGEIIIASDWDNYLAWILYYFSRNKNFIWKNNDIESFHDFSLLLDQNTKGKLTKYTNFKAKTNILLFKKNK